VLKIDIIKGDYIYSYSRASASEWMGAQEDLAAKIRDTGLPQTPK